MCAPNAEKRWVDAHVHLLALPTEHNGCLMSRRLKNGLLAKLMAKRRGWNLAEPDLFNRQYLQTLLETVSASAFVSKAVILAMDGVYDSAGKLDRTQTDLLIPNSLCLDLAHGHAEFLAGVSINPMRRDALDEIDRCAGEGAALVKWLPNAQGFDPADSRNRPFYRALAARRLPLLSHIGYEFSLIGKDQSHGDLGRLRPALDEGVTVIAAHGASFGCFVYEKYLDELLKMFERYPNLYADVSALTLPNRVGQLFNLRRYPEFHHRLIFGTDYPLPVFSYPALIGKSWSAFQTASRIKNTFDRQFVVLRESGLRMSHTNLFAKGGDDREQSRT